MGIDNYLNAYTDRRMTLLIEEYGVATKNDLRNQTDRIRHLQREVEQFQSSERENKKKVEELKKRVASLKGMKK